MDQNENRPQEPNDSEKDILSDYYQGYQQLELLSAESQVRKARNALFVVAGLTLIGNLIILGAQDQLSGIPLIIALVVSAVFAGLGLLTKTQPLTAIIIGLVLYVGLWILDIVVLGTVYLLRGMIVKGIVIYFLITGIRHAREAERLRKEIKSVQ